MFLDVSSNGPGGFWDAGPVCKSCKRLIDPSEPAEDLRFDAIDDQRLNEMAGLYHRACARPYLSVIRALLALNRLSH